MRRQPAVSAATSVGADDDPRRGRRRTWPRAGVALLRWRRRLPSLLVLVALLLLASVALRRLLRPAGPSVRRNDASTEGDGDPSFALARTQSGGFFYDVPASDWERHRAIFLAHEDHRYPEEPWKHHPSANGGLIERGDSSYEAWYQENYEPNFTCQFEKRLGVPMNGDGGKWVCDPHRIQTLAKARRAKDPSHPGCVVYSIGSSGDFTFELGIEKEMGPGVCEFHIFDMGNYEVKALLAGLKRMEYHQWGLTGNDGTPVLDGMRRDAGKPPMVQNKANKFYSLQETVKELGHDKLDKIDIFKIDCESCEWDTFRDWLSPEVPLLHQILVEVHRAPHPVAIDFFAALEEAGYARFHKEPNIQYNPWCLEYAFVNVGHSFVEGKRLDQRS